MAYFHCLIGGGSSGGGYELTVTCDADFAGTTITCTDGVTTLTQTCPSASPYEVVFAIPNGGEWTISGIISGQTYSASVDIPDSLGLHSVPQGSTVLPTDDIQTWLACAGITDKSYTTLAEVLADSTTLLALMSNNNAVDYLVRSTSWAGDSTVKVPTMTSNTTPSGVVSAKSRYDATTEPWKAFDGTGNSSGWLSSSFGNSPLPQWIQYDFGKQVNINLVYMQNKVNSSYIINQFKIQGSNDGSAFTDLTDILTNKNTGESGISTYEIESENSYRYIRMEIENVVGTVTYASIGVLQFYHSGITTDSTAMTYIGANNYCSNTLLSDSTWAEAICNSEYFESVLNAKVPTMTSNTTPSGVVISSSIYSSTYEAYKAFDKNSSTSWTEANNQQNGYVGYIFTNPVKIYKAVMDQRTDIGTGYTWCIKASNDGDEYITVSNDFITNQNTGSASYDVSIDTNGIQYSRYILYNKSRGSNNAAVAELQFYGREDV